MPIFISSIAIIIMIIFFIIISDKLGRLKYLYSKQQKEIELLKEIISTKQKKKNNLSSIPQNNNTLLKDDNLSKNNIPIQKLDASTQENEREDNKISDKLNSEYNERKDPVEAFLKVICQKTLSYFLTGNIIAKVGMLFLFIGVGFLIKLAAYNTQLTPMKGFVSAIIISIGLVILGYLLRRKNIFFSQILQGGGLGVAYITFFLDLYLQLNMIPASIVFTILVLICIFSILLALKQDSIYLIFLAQLGGFLAPLICYSDGSNVELIFSFYLVLNIAIAIIAYSKKWKAINMTGFIFTFIVASVYGMYAIPSQTDYFFDKLWSAQLFLIMFWLLYIIIDILFHRRSDNKVLLYASYTGSFLLAFWSLSLQFRIVYLANQEVSYALIALTYAIAYTLITTLLKFFLNKKNNSFIILSSIYYIISVLFYFIAILLYFDTSQSGLIIALSAGLLVIESYKRSAYIQRILGLLYLSYGLVSFYGYSLYLVTTSLNIPWLQYLLCYIPISLLVVMMYISYKCPSEDGSYFNLIDKSYKYLLSIIYILSNSIFLIAAHQYDLLLISIILPVVMVGKIGVIKSRAIINFPLSYLSILCLLLSIPCDLKTGISIFTYLIYSIIYLCLTILINRYDNKLRLITNKNYCYSLFIVLWIVIIKIIVALVLVDMNWQITIINSFDLITFLNASLCIIGLALIINYFFGLFLKEEDFQIKAFKYNILPLSYISILYLFIIINMLSAIPIYLTLSNISIVSNLFYMLAAYLLILIWLRKNINALLNYSVNLPIYIVVANIILTCFWLIFLNYALYILIIGHTLVDFGSSIFNILITFDWVILSIATILLSKKILNRKLWLIGIGILPIAIIKLLLIDLSHSTSLIKVISIIIMGLLLLLVGYVCPIPDKNSVSKN